MIRICVYNYRPDEHEFFVKFAEEYGVELVPLNVAPTLETMELATGCQAVSITSDAVISPAMIDRLQELGIKFLSSRTVGLDHVDRAYCQQVCMPFANVSYNSEGVAETAIMLMLMLLKRYKPIDLAFRRQDYTLNPAHRGRDLNAQTVGVMGTGAIGAVTVRDLAGFGCRVLAYDPYPNAALEGLCEYVEMDQLLAESDIVTLHMPAIPATLGLMNAETIGKMKDGALLINTARGELVENAALIEALQSGKLGGAGLDMIEGCRTTYYRSFEGQPLPMPELGILQDMDNVILTPHTAFYTDRAVSDMVELSIRSIVEYFAEK